jgi:hypothetical protein
MRLLAAPVKPWWACGVEAHKIPPPKLEHFIEPGGLYSSGLLMAIDGITCIFLYRKHHYKTLDIRLFAASVDPRFPCSLGATRTTRRDKGWLDAGKPAKHSNLDPVLAHPSITKKMQHQIEVVIGMVIRDAKKKEMKNEKVLRRNTAKVKKRMARDVPVKRK